MELLIDTDSIIKLGRYQLLNEFETLAVQSGHAKPFRNLYEIKSKIQTADRDPPRSEFGSMVALNICRSFVSDCKTLDRAEDHKVLEALREVDGIDPGEALLIEYALRKHETIIVSGDKRMVRGLTTAPAATFRKTLQNRLLFVERIVWALAQGNPNWATVRKKILDVPGCDEAIYNAVRPSLSDVDAQAELFKATTHFERTSFGLLRSSI